MNLLAKRIREIRSLLFILIIAAFVFSFDPIAAYPDDSDVKKDEYGIPVRNDNEKLPSWYYENTGDVKFYHDSTIPRVVDMADMLTKEEEEEIKEKIAVYSAETGKDLVVVTDKSDYGLGFELYCYDFYDFNGYGYGDEYEGICLFICMDPVNRGGWTGATGSVSRSLYTETVANDIDDVLYEHLGAGEYAEGISAWTDAIYCLYTKGIPFAPDWYPTDAERAGYVRKHNGDAPRVDDTIEGVGAFLAEQEKELSARAKEISEKYGVDVVIHTTPTNYNMGYERYIDDYYYYNGYGLGDDHNAIVLCIFDRFNKIYIVPFGRIKEELSEVNYKRMKEQSEDAADYYEAACKFLDNLDHWERTGRVTRTAGQWVFAAIVTVLVGLFFGKKGLKRAKKKMVTVRSAYGADNYISEISDFSTGTDTFVDRSVQKTKIPRYTSSGSSSSRSSSSGGRSTYHSSSRGSSGRSHSGSGRRF